MHHDPTFFTIPELLSAYRTRKLSPYELMQAVFDRIDKLNPKINAFVTLARESALKEAKAASRALKTKSGLKPLHGVPVSIKDVTPTRGIRTTWASKIFENFVPDQDALVVERLKAAGAIVIGKTNTPEFAAGGHTFNTLFGPTRNPWNLALTAGGSSGGGAAAVATGMGPIAEGSDLGGSLRTPAAFCGVVGFRGTPGLIPNYPTQLAWNTLAVHGPIARTVDDVARVLAAVAGRDDRDPMSYDVDTRVFLNAVRRPDIKGWKIAWSEDLGGEVPVDEEIARVAKSAMRVFRKLGAKVTSESPDFSGLEDIILGTRGLSMVAAHADKLAKWRNDMQAGLVWNIEQGLSLSVKDIARAELLRTDLWDRVRKFMEQYDLLVLPGTAAKPFPVELPYPTEIRGKHLTNYQQWFFLTYAASLVALPVISVPCGFTKGGLPVGLQIVGRRLSEASVLCAAAAFERASPWRDWRPPVLSK
jgi:amidase